MKASVNLQELVFERAPRKASAAVRRPAMLGYVLPAAILCGFAAVVGWSLREWFWPPKAVTVIPVIATRAEVVAADTPLFQAAGWVEPRPQPVVVPALVEGIVDQMLVVEGQRVEAGQTVARLVRRDAEIALNRAAADVRLREAEVISAQAALTAAQSLFNEPIPLLAALTDADAALAKTETELARLPALIRAAEARREFSEQELAGRTLAPDAVPALTIRRTQSDLETALAQLDEYRQQTKSLERERLALARRRDVLQRQLELKVDETRQVAEAEAKVEMTRAQLDQAQAAREAALLALDRTEVRATSTGHVLALVAKPGSRLMGSDRSATNDSSTVITMFDPKSLQVRADVRLDDVPRVAGGQAVRIETPAYAQPISGRVLMATALTDIQKNTLQVKLSIEEPPAVLKPDMLVQVTFLAPPRPNSVNSGSTLRIMAPQDLIHGSGNDATVWLADQSSGKAVLRRVMTGDRDLNGLIEITTGLNVGDRLIASGRESLVDGQRIRISGNDPGRGRESAASTNLSKPVKSSEIDRSGVHH